MTINTVQITFFSGTGGVKRFADAFEQECLRRGLTVNRSDLDHSIHRQRAQPSEAAPAAADLILLLFPLHAFDAPEIIYTWIRRAQLSGQPVAVLSVSGGGEAWPNTGCRNRCCRAIEDKGGRVVYERMLCMPSNWTFAASDPLAMHLLQAIPRKVNLVLDEVLAGKVRRTQSRMSPLRASLARLEKEHTAEFPRNITITETCTGCGVCESQCPVENIKLRDHRPVFSNACCMCFRCIYACPAHALQSSNFMVLKEGYDLRALEKRMQGVALEPVEQCASGLMWGAVRDYLLDREG
jgi:ferredoxin